jgi:hypothetical protein
VHDRFPLKSLNFEKTLRELLIQLNQLGAGPNLNLVDISMRRALVTASMSMRLKLEHLPPNQRSTFADLAKRWFAAHAQQKEPEMRAA